MPKYTIEQLAEKALCSMEHEEFKQYIRESLLQLRDGLINEYAVKKNIACWLYEDRSRMICKIADHWPSTTLLLQIEKELR